MIYYIDKFGNHRFEKNLFSRERIDVGGDNPLFEKIMKSD